MKESHKWTARTAKYKKTTFVGLLNNTIIIGAEKAASKSASSITTPVKDAAQYSKFDIPPEDKMVLKDRLTVYLSRQSGGYISPARPISKSEILEHKAQHKVKMSLPRPGDKDVYEIEQGKLYIKLDYARVKNEVTDLYAGSAGNIMSKINATLENIRIARKTEQWGIKYLPIKPGKPGKRVELKFNGDLRIWGDLQQGEYLNQDGQTIKYQYAILGEVAGHNKMARTSRGK
jgi:hypothetical protein